MSPRRQQALNKCFRDIERAASIHATPAERAAANRAKEMIAEVVEELENLGTLRAVRHRLMETTQEKVHAFEA